MAMASGIGIVGPSDSGSRCLGVAIFVGSDSVTAGGGEDGAAEEDFEKRSADLRDGGYIPDPN